VSNKWNWIANKVIGAVAAGPAALTDTAAQASPTPSDTAR
jgi:hypothetical protein